ncbi:hypothetical protein [Ruegeria lacuscaerulensis]|uniref:hypothetical protein n=1 Tax=Ruegeria lacuscaerulensis TaxID=55218 RepID=UPI00147F26A9|nr:hypothetical protein [Ruegeria lacuscaerulensis]
MNAQQWLDTYLEGWRTGDAEKSLSATVPDFFYDDPATGRICRDKFVQFVEDFKAAGAELAGGQVPSPFLQYSDITVSAANPATAWCWWRVTGTNFQGAAIIRFGDAGVISERIAYFTTDPVATPIPDQVKKEG